MGFSPHKEKIVEVAWSKAGGRQNPPRHWGLSPWFPRWCATVAHKRGNHPDKRGGGETIFARLPKAHATGILPKLNHVELSCDGELGPGIAATTATSGFERSRAADGSTMIFCQILRDSPEVKSSRSLTADTASGSSKC